MNNIHIQRLENNSAETAGFNIVWLPGWGQSGGFIKPLAECFAAVASNYLIDLPGFGQSSAPSAVWSSEDYADAVIERLQNYLGEPEKPIVLVGHSYGGRVAMQAARKFPNKVKAVVMIAASGLKSKKSIGRRLKQSILWILAKTARIFEGIFKINLRERFGQRFRSADYRQSSGIMRSIFLKAVQENLTEEAKTVSVPALIIYGLSDTETPAEYGRRYHQLIADSDYIELPHFDHYSILDTGRHQLQNIISEFLEKLVGRAEER